MIGEQKQKNRVQNICANGTHFYLGKLKNNDEIRESIEEMVNHVIEDHVPDRFYVDTEVFDTVYSHLDYIAIKQIREKRTRRRSWGRICLDDWSL